MINSQRVKTMEEDKITFHDIITVLYAGPAIIHVNMHYRKELFAGTLKESHYQLYDILHQIELITAAGMVTELGNKVFGCVDLIRYCLLTGMDMSTVKKPDKKDWQYDILRKGLGQLAIANSIEYIDFMHTYMKGDLHTMLDLGCGDGTYSMLLGDRYNIPKCILVERDTDAVYENLEALYPDGYDNYFVSESDIGIPLHTRPYKADLVLMKEVLHLKDEVWWSVLMANALSNSTPNGQICIGEVRPHSAFDWRMESYTDEGRAFRLDEFMHWINNNYQGHFEEEFGALVLDTHWYVILTKRAH